MPLHTNDSAFAYQFLYCHRYTHARIFTAIPQTLKYLIHTIASDTAMSALPQTYTHPDIHGNTSNTEILDTHHRLRYSNVCTAVDIHTDRCTWQHLRHRNTWDTPGTQMQQCLQCHRDTQRTTACTPQWQCLDTRYAYGHWYIQSLWYGSIRHWYIQSLSYGSIRHWYIQSLWYGIVIWHCHMVSIPRVKAIRQWLYVPVPYGTISQCHMTMTVCTSAFLYQWQWLYTPRPAGSQK